MTGLGDVYKVPARTGTEPITEEANLTDFWRWMGSDLVTNTMRGTLAEYLVALAVGAADGVREEWAPYDVETEDGIKIEVKSSAYLQSWPQKKESAPRFGIPRRQVDVAIAEEHANEQKRRSDVYVFCLLRHRENKATLDPLDMAQWTFYVLPTATLDDRLGDQKEIGLNTLEELRAKEVPFGGIADAVRQAAPSKR